MTHLDTAEDDFSTYSYLRQVLEPGLAVAPASVIRLRMEAEFGEGAADIYNDQLESIFGDIGKFVSKAAPIVANVGGGIVQGAMAGSSLGLPGIIGGAVVGGAGKALSTYGGGGTLGKIGGALTGVTNIAGQFSPMGRIGASIGPAISGLAGIGQGKAGAMGAATGVLNGILGAATGGAGGGALGSLLGGGGAGGAAKALTGMLGGGGGGAGAALSGLLGGAGGAGGAGSAISGLLGAVGGGGGVGQAIGGLLQNPAAAQAIGGHVGGSSAAGQLASFMQRPETQQAFAALQLGRMGRPTVPVGAARVPVPTAAFPEVLSHLADQVSAEAASWSGDAESALEYMQDAEGDYVGDPAFGRDRAARVWDLLNEAQAERVLGEFVDMGEAAASRAAPAARPRPVETEAESWVDWEAEAEADAEWFDTLDALDSASGDNEWGDSEWDFESGDNESGDNESGDNEYEYEAEGEYADA